MMAGSLGWFFVLFFGVCKFSYGLEAASCASEVGDCASDSEESVLLQYSQERHSKPLKESNISLALRSPEYCALLPCEQVVLLCTFRQICCEREDECLPDPRPKFYKVPVITEGMEYRIPLAVGTPSKRFELLIDTGSTPTWLINPDAQCKPGGGSASACESFGMRFFNCSASSTCTDGRPTGPQRQAYGSGETNMTMKRDLFSFGGSDGMQLIMGDAFWIKNARYLFEGGHYDGFLGLGWPGGIDFGDAQSKMESTFIIQLLQQKVVDKAVFGLNLGSKKYNGTMTIGGIDESEFQGEITWAPLDGDDWFVRIDGVRIRDGQLMGSASKALMDTGAFATIFPRNDLTWISIMADIAKHALLVFQWDEGLSLYLPLVRCSEVSLLPDLTIVLSGKQFILSPQTYVYTDRQTIDIITAKTQQVPQGACIVGMLQFEKPRQSFFGIDVLLGNNFLKAFYSTWDIEGKRFGLAKLPSTSSTTTTTPFTTTTSTPTVPGWCKVEERIDQLFSVLVEQSCNSTETCMEILIRVWFADQERPTWTPACQLDSAGACSVNPSVVKMGAALPAMCSNFHENQTCTSGVEVETMVVDYYGKNISLGNSTVCNWTYPYTTPKCLDNYMGQDFCSGWCNNPSHWGCGIATTAPVLNNYTCDCTGCNGCLPPDQCKDEPNGKNYCSEWCNTKWSCGVNVDGAHTCDCAGCNGCD